MSTNIVNQDAFLRTSRSFPMEPQELSVEISKSYIDIANVVNSRTIGIFSTQPSITGNSWFLGGNSSKRQTIRQIYSISGAGTYTHNINTGNISGFSSIYGTFTNGTNWYPLPYIDATAANNQVQLVITPTQIVITSGTGAPPTISSGFVVLEWISQI